MSLCYMTLTGNLVFIILCFPLIKFYCVNFESSFIAVIFVVLEEDFFCDADEGELSEQGQVP